MTNIRTCCYIALIIMSGTSICHPAMAGDTFNAPSNAMPSEARIANTATSRQANAGMADTNSYVITASTNSWFMATNWTQRLDWLHDTANFVSEANISRADSWFVNDPGKRIPFEPAKLRLGLQIEMDYFTHTNKFALRPLADTECQVHMLNAEQRIRMTISTLDPMALPGQDSNEGMSGFRIGLKKWILKDIDTGIGVRLKWLPSVYANIAWDPRYKTGEWEIYPEQKLGWDSDDGIYEISSLMINRWVNRWMIRPIASLKLSRERYKSDQDKLDEDRAAAEAAGLPPPDGNYPKGWDWELTLLAGYAWELFDESVYGRLADGSDVARGGGFRLSALGNLHIVESYNLTFLYRGPLYKQWLYYLVKPAVSWENDNDWVANYSLALGLDILMYGTANR